MQQSPCGRYLLSTDTLHKTVVANFPNVATLQSVNTDQKSSIIDILFFRDSIASIAQDPAKPFGNLVISDLHSG